MLKDVKRPKRVQRNKWRKLRRVSKQATTLTFTPWTTDQAGTGACLPEAQFGSWSMFVRVCESV